MTDPKGGVILYLCNKRTRPITPVPGFHIEFLSVSKITAEGEYGSNFKLPWRRIIVLNWFLWKTFDVNEWWIKKNVGSSNSLKPSTGHAYTRKGATQSRIKRDKIPVLEHVPKNQSLIYISAKARRERFLKENPRGLSSPNQWKCHSGVLTTWPKKCKGFFNHKMCGFKWVESDYFF